MKIGFLVSFIAIVLTSSFGVRADDLDILLEEKPVKKSVKKSSKKTIVVPSEEVIEVTDPFLRQFYAEVLTNRRLTKAEREWAKGLIRENYEEAIKQYSGVKLGSEFKKSADIALIYSFWKTGLGQTFINAWIEGAYHTGLSKIALWESMEQRVQEDFNEWAESAPIVLTPRQKNLVLSQKASDETILITLKALALLREASKPEVTVKLLETLPDGHPFKLPLAQNYGFSFVTKGNMKQAARAFKEYVEPAIGGISDPELKAELTVNYYLNIARLLYQGKQYQGSISYFDKVPSGSDPFVKSREEVIWPLLVTKNYTRLRGELETLSLPIYKSKYSPETYVVRALVNLQFCFFQQVEKDIKEFMVVNQSWAAKIDGALKLATPPLPLEPDYYTTLAGQSVKSITREYGKIKSLAGNDAFLKTQLQNLSDAQRQARTEQQLEHKRQWNNDKKVLAEAIRKMKFIRIEFLSETRLLQAKTQKWRENLLASRAQETQGTDVIASDAGNMIYKYDGVLWSDELFKLRSTTPGRCQVWLKGEAK